MKFNTLFIVIFLSCAPPPPEPIVMPLTKSAVVEPLQETIYTLGYMSEYDIWEFLKGKRAWLQQKFHIYLQVKQ